MLDISQKTVTVTSPGKAPVTYTAAGNPDKFREALTRMWDIAKVYGRENNIRSGIQIRAVIRAILRELYIHR